MQAVLQCMTLRTLTWCCAMRRASRGSGQSRSCGCNGCVRHATVCGGSNFQLLVRILQAGQKKAGGKPCLQGAGCRSSLLPHALASKGTGSRFASHQLHHDDPQGVDITLLTQLAKLLKQLQGGGGGQGEWAGVSCSASIRWSMSALELPLALPAPIPSTGEISGPPAHRVKAVLPATPAAYLLSALQALAAAHGLLPLLHC